MNTYTLTYNTGDTEDIQAARVEWGDEGTDRHYRAVDDQGDLVLVAHFHGVRSIRRKDLADSPLVDHARRELTLLGEDPWIVDGILDVVSAFAAMGHSGTSAEAVTGYLERLLRFKALTPLTDDPAEWEDRSEMSGYPIWQNARDSRAMSRDGGKTYTLVDEQPVTSDSGQPVHTSTPKAA